MNTTTPTATTRLAPLVAALAALLLAASPALAQEQGGDAMEKDGDAMEKDGDAMMEGDKPMPAPAAGLVLAGLGGAAVLRRRMAQPRSRRD